MNNIIISTITYTSLKYQAVFELRDEVLRRPLGMSLKNDDLSRDHIDTIFIAEHTDKLAGCVLLHDLGQGVGQLRAMAVYSQWQHKGVGKQLVRALEIYATAHGYTKIVLHARQVATEFYSRLGYTVTSDEFTEVGIPHFMMEKGLPINMPE